MERRQGERRRGRPASAEPLRNKIEVRVTSDEKRRLREVAKLNHQTVTEFVRDAVRDAAAECDDEPVLRPSRNSRQTEIRP
jgi:uncharacterized protein (DUF1778 family)